MRRALVLTVAFTFVSTVAFVSSVGARSTALSEHSSAIAKHAPCGITANYPHYDHVVWIVLENVGYSVVGSAQAPYLNTLGSQCGLATNYFAISHPSLPNYIAMTSGTTAGITDDAEPSAHHVSGPSLFSQLGTNWRALEESMPQACDHVTSGSYAARHNPAVYFDDLASSCRREDVPLSWPLNIGARFTFITPNICDDMHSCPVADGDAWLSRAVPAIINSSLYRSRSLVLFITFDENDSGANNHVPTFVIAPSVPRGIRVAETFTHYSLLRTTESLLGLSFIAGAKTASSLATAFHL